MSQPKPRAAKKDTTLHFSDPVLFEKVREALAVRGLDGLPMATMVRIALSEWAKEHEPKESK